MRDCRNLYLILAGKRGESFFSGLETWFSERILTDQQWRELAILGGEPGGNKTDRSAAHIAEKIANNCDLEYRFECLQEWLLTKKGTIKIHPLTQKFLDKNPSWHNYLENPKTMA